VIKTVAIKELRLADDAEKLLKERKANKFEYEAQIMAKMNHPNVLGVIGYVKEKKANMGFSLRNPWILMSMFFFKINREGSDGKYGSEFRNGGIAVVEWRNGGMANGGTAE
jgi:hypothetical protein